jgi:hypothetical protein
LGLLRRGANFSDEEKPADASDGAEAGGLDAEEAVSFS